MKIRLIQGEALETMEKLAKEGIVFNAIITDPPYQITVCSWDKMIPLNKYMIGTRGRSKKEVAMYENEWILKEAMNSHKTINECRKEFKEKAKDGMWDKINKIKKDTTPVILFGSEPFSSELRMSNAKEYKYDWFWKKEAGTGFLNAKKQPLRAIENISVFYKTQSLYNPQMRKGFKPYVIKKGGETDNYRGDSVDEVITKSDGSRYPLNTLHFARDKTKYHPTGKPVALIEYLIKTYTNEGDLILDFTAGSFTTAIACMNLKRNFVGIELDEKYFEIGKNRVKEHAEKLDYNPEIIIEN